MFILYFCLLVCPLCVFVWTFRVSHEASYRSVGTDIFKWLMYAYGVAGVVGIFMIESWSIARYVLFMLGYGIPAIVALIAYYKYLSKQKTNIVSDKKMDIRQTIDIKKEEGAI